MNKKMFWNGLGFGLILGAILLQLMLSADQAPILKPSVPPESIESNKLYSQSDLDQKVQAKLQEELEKLSAQVSVKQTAVFISSGLNSEKVVDMFLQTGLISDVTEMNAEIKKRKLAAKIRTGVHVFEGQPGIDTILETITRKP